MSSSAHQIVWFANILISAWQTTLHRLGKGSQDFRLTSRKFCSLGLSFGATFEVVPFSVLGRDFLGPLRDLGRGII